METRICPKCKGDVLEAENTCPFCGCELCEQEAALDGRGTAPSSLPTEPKKTVCVSSETSAVKTTGGKRKKRVGVIVGVITGVLAMICIAVLIFMINNPFQFALNEDGTYTLIHCNKYVKKAKIPESYEEQPVTKIDKGAFLGCEKLISVEIPNSITVIDDYAFEGCVSLTDITIPNSVTKIGYCVFEGCVSLTGITIPNSVTKIDYRAFGGCTSLTSLIFEGNSRLNLIDVYAFEDCPLEYAVLPTAAILAIPKKQLKELTINSGKSLDQWAFANCKNLEIVTIGDQITTIGDGAFEDCEKLKVVTIGNGVRKIDVNAFSECTSLTSVIFGDKNQLTSIGEWAFYGCKSLTSITILKSVTSIGAYAFAECTSLANIKYNGSEAQWYWWVHRGLRWDYYAGEYTVTFAVAQD